MKEYFIVVITVTFLGGTLVSLAPSGAGQRYLRLIAALAVVGCIILPLFSFFNDWEMNIEDMSDMFSYGEESNQNYDEIYNNSIVEAGAKNLSNTLKNEIVQALEADYDDIDLTVVVNNNSDEIYIERVEVIIYPSGLSLDPHFMENYVSERLDCECEIIYKSEK